MLWRRKPNRDAGTPASAPHRQTTTATTLTRGHLNDLTIGLGQQMFFWGRDVLTDGNLLLKHGFQKHRSEGLQGTSCYCKPWEDGMIELHGACAGWYPCEGGQCGFLFIRNAKRCYIHHRTTPVVPGEYDFSEFDSSNLPELTRSSRIFTAWLAEYEAWIAKQMGRAYREECHAMFCKLPTSKPWLEPEKARRWIVSFAAASPSLPRAKMWA
jgi:hypothetical protein